MALVPSNVFLRRMTGSEFEKYLSTAIPGFAQEKMRAEKMSAAEAEQVSIESYKNLLPKGVESPDQFLFTIVEAQSNQGIGMIWFAKKISAARKQAFVYDFEIEESFRGRGYGKEALLLIETEARALGLDSMGLHVFGHNKDAYALYKKSGYQETNIVMAKNL